MRCISLKIEQVIVFSIAHQQFPIDLTEQLLRNKEVWIQRNTPALCRCEIDLYQIKVGEATTINGEGPIAKPHKVAGKTKQNTAINRRERQRLSVSCIGRNG